MDLKQYKDSGHFQSLSRALLLIYREAIRNDKVASNPARAGSPKAGRDGRIRYLLDEEEKALRETILEMFAEHLPELVIAIGSGMRKGEQYALTSPQVDFHRKEVHLHKTKNNEARDIPANSDVVAAFETLRGNRKKPTGRVFAISNPKGWFESPRAKSGVTNFRWHDCRHTFCSRLAMAGVPLKTIQVLAGHKTIAITARYAHLASNTLHSAVELITEAAKAKKESPEQRATGTAIVRKKGILLTS